MSHENVEVVRRALEAFNEGGFDAMAEFLDPEINWRAAEGALDDVGEMHGVEAVRSYIQEWIDMFDGFAVQVHDLRDLGGDRVLTEQEVAGRARISGAETELRFFVIYTVRGGRVVRGREYLMREAALDAAGLGENVEVVRRFLDARLDLEASLPLIDPDIEWIPLRAATEGVYRGHAGMERFLNDTLESFETFEPEFELREAPGGRVLAWGVIHVRGNGSGVEVDVPTGGYFEVRDGRVSRWEDFGSKEKALDAVGPRE